MQTRSATYSGFVTAAVDELTGGRRRSLRNFLLKNGQGYAPEAYDLAFGPSESDLKASVIYTVDGRGLVTVGMGGWMMMGDGDLGHVAVTTPGKLGARVQAFTTLADFTRLSLASDLPEAERAIVPVVYNKRQGNELREIPGAKQHRELLASLDIPEVSVSTSLLKETLEQTKGADVQFFGASMADARKIGKVLRAGGAVVDISPDDVPPRGFTDFLRHFGIGLVEDGDVFSTSKDPSLPQRRRAIEEERINIDVFRIIKLELGRRFKSD